MSARTVVAALVLLVSSGCRRSEPSAIADAQAQPAPPAASVASPVDSAPAPEEPPSGVEPAEMTPPPKGPEPNSGPAERKRVLSALLSGAHRLGELPEVATEPNVGFDRGLRRRLTTVEVEVADPLSAPGPAPLRGIVQIGSASATVPISNLDRVVAGLRPRFRQCYQTALAEDPAIAGKVTMKAVVETNGEVADATVLTSSGIPKRVCECIAGVIRRAQFDSPESKSVVTIPVTMVRE